MWRIGVTIMVVLLASGLVFVPVGACPRSGQETGDAAGRRRPSGEERTGSGPGAPTVHGSPDGDPSATLPNLMKLSDRIYSGGEPTGAEDFATLKALGVKTLVSVDGAKPDVETAGRYGLRYIHVPIGYDGIPEEAGQAMARIMRDCEGPIYFHCHHGRHRGPAAAAVACIASGEADSKQAVQILERAGTSRDYAGLWRDVASYSPPPPGTPLPELVEIAEVNSLAAAMARIDRSFDNLDLCREANWSTPPGHPDLVPAQEALIVREGFYEAARNLPQVYGDGLLQKLKTAESVAGSLEETLNTEDTNDAAKLFQRLANSCRECHTMYRNQ